ncbi:MAG: amino acid ABC transporter substrate-binding protein [Xanthobacteraceae bacterium]
MKKTFKTGLSIGLAVAAAVVAAAWTYIRYDANTLRKVRARGELLCGVNTGLPGFSSADAQGNWSGFDVDFCRAVAAAIFNDPKKVKFVPLDASERFKELRDRKIDILSRNSTWNLSRELGFGLHFAAVSYSDGQGFMVRRSKNAETALELDGTKVCFQSGTTTQRNLADYFRTNNMKYQEVRFDKLDEVLKAYESGQCDVMTSDVSQLYAQRLRVSNPGEHVILPDVISKDPLAPVVRHKDDDWLLLVKWTFFAMLNAEELGITSKNINEAMKSTKPDVMRFVGNEGTYGEDMRLTKDWAARIIKHVGNYEEVFERNLGSESPLGIPRGLNQLWNAGGIQYAPPIL